MGTKKRTWHAAIDTDEQISRCLNCTRSSCVNCIGTEQNRERYERQLASGWKRKIVHKTVFYYVDGVRVNEKAIELLRCYPTLTTDEAIAEQLHIAPPTVCCIRKRLGLPRANTDVEEKLRLSQHYLDEIRKLDEGGGAA